MTAVLGTDRVLTAARRRLDRVGPVEAKQLVDAGDAILVDIRPAAQRAIEGEFPDAHLIERNVLEWRLDPTGEARISELTELADQGVLVIVACSGGYASSLAAASLLDVGVRRATDLDGGFQAWRARGLPVR